ncbi:hypothetical protein [Chelativorans sp. YIM 93263]|uniref:hypothetical protein n=1 Tax=Chelativorans sp. YIM 93263 TaxID=2906648 RepID=UPI002377D4DA|nr:hypothetical protein [Chelativorans sp. YIM 93263]
MRTMIAAIAGLCVTPLLLTQAPAEDRFRLERTENGYVRMDTETGTMSLCREQSGELVCQSAAEEQQALENENGNLRERVSRLEERVDALEGDTAADLSVEQEFEQAMGMMERFFRRFMDMVQGFEQEQEEPLQNGGTEQPDRT